MSGEADEAEPSTSAAAAAAASSSLPSIASSLRAPDGMAFAVEHNASDNSHTFRVVPEDEAAQRRSTAQSQSSVSNKPGKETSSLGKILFTETQFQVGRWLCSFVIMFAGVAVVAKHPFMRISRFTTFNIALASLHSVSASLLVLPNASPDSAKPTMTYAIFVFVDFIVNFAASFLMIHVRASEKTMASNIAFFASCISLFTCLGSVICVIYRCKSKYSAKDLQGVPDFYRRSQNGQRTDDVELDTFRRSGDTQSHPDGGVEGEPSETASVHSFKGDDSKITNHLAAAFRSISRMHAFQTVLALAIFAISAAVAAQHPDIHHYASATNTFIINTWYLIYVISSVIFTSLANVFMWHIYATDQYLPAFFAGWAGAIIA
ncbi:hypothetical protein K4F52_007859 [Lecanicillium sp. MT-2017a]|nr:hypothetical protein K4F52_007859 [Lecanicillium sp. MT-2017a]